MKKRVSLAALAALVLGGLGALAVGCGDEEPSAKTQIQPMERTIYMEAVEPKGSTNIEKEPFPTELLPAGGGYVLEEPDDKGDWVVETYAWTPDQVVVYEGDTVNLEIIGINGDRHDSLIENYVESFVVERGKLTSLTFTADKAGVFKFVCTIHQPSMTGELVVLPRP